ncbi:MULTISPECIES: tRNA (adenosine(37)-N6)-dimethylallyltransferase MiaA [Parachlamydia]|uniref:tRNA dimethylallyltransferase n=1 Tax=Parachlamydia acanthamoebae (strain UV7) TaxID=765952 RepID=F8KZF2_PARAV|nr:tRNA (adenosine(37)-N6)-dimethylallyltransferase MiaA [Parachlamydia acanthamoebae]EFB41821.1 hypothetical protein pah_c022o115 [Parachlamydia acanthamoebae str. Hall's coccus]CCB86292.1 tRNA dimethylaLLyltransferase [Parachlamydia acanthamoebae UV-7]
MNSTKDVFIKHHFLVDGTKGLVVSGVIEREEVERIVLNFAVEAQKQIPVNLQRPRKRVIVISGPTGCGKTAFSLKLAQEIGGEIISADSMQIYRGMDIGTAKATQKEREAIPHHLLDIRDVSEAYNVVDFYYEARQCCEEIHSRGNVPIITGGSGFYLHSLLYGPPSGPPSLPELRKALEAELEQKGSEFLYEKLKQLDSQYAHSITKHDKQKIIRALEILTLTGKKVSRLSWKGRRKPRNYDFRCWFLYRPKEHLYRRIDHRCEKMVEAGLLEEVEKLEKEGLLQNPSAAQAIGYRQALEYFKTPKTKEDFQKFMDDFKKSSRRYAKRQFTWFRQEPLFQWLDLDLHDLEVAVEMVRRDYEIGL